MRGGGEPERGVQRGPRGGKEKKKRFNLRVRTGWCLSLCTTRVRGWLTHCVASLQSYGAASRPVGGVGSSAGFDHANTTDTNACLQACAALRMRQQQQQHTCARGHSPALTLALAAALLDKDDGAGHDGEEHAGGDEQGRLLAGLHHGCLLADSKRVCAGSEGGEGGASRGESWTGKSCRRRFAWADKCACVHACPHARWRHPCKGTEARAKTTGAARPDFQE